MEKKLTAVQWLIENAKGFHNAESSKAMQEQALRMEREQIELNKMKWISVKERLPIKGDEVLCYSEEGCVSVEKIRYNNDIPYCEQTDSGYATHWMPLPKPPKQD
jgi:hypothetical protein